MKERIIYGQVWMEENVDGWKDGSDEHWSDAAGTERLVMEICVKEQVNTVDEKRDGWEGNYWKNGLLVRLRDRKYKG